VLVDVCHIKGEKPEAARYDVAQSDDNRRAFENLMLLCTVHHRIVDTNEARYDADRLHALKALNEAADGQSEEPSEDLVSRVLLRFAQNLGSSVPRGESVEAANRKLAELPTDTLPAPTSVPAVSTMPLRRNPCFQGREDDLLALATNLKMGRVTAISQVIAATGIGGVGKSQLASEFVYRFGQFFSGGVFWLNFEDPDAVDAEVASCGHRLQLHPAFAKLSLQTQVQLIRAEWESDMPRLLVFDNCGDEELLQQWILRTGGCRVLITARRTQWDPVLGVQVWALDVLPLNEAVALVSELSGYLSPDDPTVGAIAEELGRLPLALHLAGSFLRRYHFDVTPAVYLEQLRQPELLDHPSLQGGGISPTQHEMHVSRTFAISYDKLDANNPIDRTALRVLDRTAYFASGLPIPRAALLSTLGLTDGSAQERLLVSDAITRLVDLGLVQLGVEGALLLHRLVATFIRTVEQDNEGLAAVLSSPVPLLVFEAARIALPLAAPDSDCIGLPVRSLCSHHQRWTQLASLRIAFECGDEYVDMEGLKSYLVSVSEIGRPFLQFLGYNLPFLGSYEWHLHNDVLQRGAALLVRGSSPPPTLTVVEKTPETEALLERVLLNAPMSAGTSSALNQLLLNTGYSELVRKKQEATERRFPMHGGLATLFAPTPDRDREFDQALLEAIQRAAAGLGGGTDGAREPEQLTVIAMLLGGMGWIEAAIAPVDRVHVLRERTDVHAVDTVLRGTIAASGLEPDRLFTEATWALEHVDRGPWRQPYGGTLVGLPRAPVTCDWQVGAQLDLSAVALARALKHPVEPIAWAAAQLLAYGAGGDEAPDRIREVLEEDNPQALHLISELAPIVWKEEAPSVILDRLEVSRPPGSEYLMLKLPALVDVYEDGRSLDILEGAIFADDPDTAKAAVDVLEADPSRIPLDRAPRLKEGLDYWSNGGSRCHRHAAPVFSDFCPCGIGVTNPRPGLMHALDELGQLSLEDAERLSIDPSHKVRKTAAAIVARIVGESPQLLDRTLQRVQREDMPMDILDAILQLPGTQLQTANHRLVELTGESSPEIRERITNALASAAWLRRETAQALAERLLRDTDPGVRNQALRTLRALSTAESPPG